MQPKSLEAAEVLGDCSWEVSQACSGESEVSTLKPKSLEAAAVIRDWSWEVSQASSAAKSGVSALKPKSSEAAEVLGDWSWEVSHVFLLRRVRSQHLEAKIARGSRSPGATVLGGLARLPAQAGLRSAP